MIEFHRSRLPLSRPQLQPKAAALKLFWKKTSELLAGKCKCVVSDGHRKGRLLFGLPRRLNCPKRATFMATWNSNGTWPTKSPPSNWSNNNGKDLQKIPRARTLVRWLAFYLFLRERNVRIGSHTFSTSLISVWERRARTWEGLNMGLCVWERVRECESEREKECERKRNRKREGEIVRQRVMVVVGTYLGSTIWKSKVAKLCRMCVWRLIIRAVRW